MKLGMQVGLGPVHIALVGDIAPHTERGTAPPTFRPMSDVAKRSVISAAAEILLDLATPVPSKTTLALCLLRRYCHCANIVCYV